MKEKEEKWAKEPWHKPVLHVLTDFFIRTEGGPTRKVRPGYFENEADPRGPDYAQKSYVPQTF